VNSSSLSVGTELHDVDADVSCRMSETMATSVEQALHALVGGPTSLLQPIHSRRHGGRSREHRQQDYEDDNPCGGGRRTYAQRAKSRANGTEDGYGGLILLKPI
jgi:hypothetical protein